LFNKKIKLLCEGKYLNDTLRYNGKVKTKESLEKKLKIFFKKLKSDQTLSWGVHLKLNNKIGIPFEQMALYFSTDTTETVILPIFYNETQRVESYLTFKLFKNKFDFDFIDRKSIELLNEVNPFTISVKNLFDIFDYGTCNTNEIPQMRQSRKSDRTLYCLTTSGTFETNEDGGVECTPGAEPGSMDICIEKVIVVTHEVEVYNPCPPAPGSGGGVGGGGGGDPSGGGGEPDKCICKNNTQTNLMRLDYPILFGGPLSNLGYTNRTLWITQANCKTGYYKTSLVTTPVLSLGTSVETTHLTELEESLTKLKSGCGYSLTRIVAGADVLKWGPDWTVGTYNFDFRSSFVLN
jgi:hypothetical protein